jgi:hypothetical protein
MIISPAKPAAKYEDAIVFQVVFSRDKGIDVYTG